MVKNKIGFWAVFGIVTGSQVGSGIFTLPGCLAQYGGIGLLGCILAGIGAIAICMVFAALCARFPYTGGPHVYVKHILGDRIAFFCGWTYWVISWVSTTAVVVTSVGYLAPLLQQIFKEYAFFITYQAEIYLLLEILLLLLICLLNLQGIKFAGNAEFLLTVLKCIPLMILPILALRYFDKINFQPIKLTNTLWPNFKLLGQVTLLVFWGFIGLEAATAPADSVIKPKTTIPRAIVIGTLSVALLYILNFVGIMGLLPATVLTNATAPYVVVAQKLFGGNWYLVISLLGSLVCLGALHAWVLTSGQIALGLAKDGFMPKLFKITNKHQAPVYGIIISCIGIVPLLLLTAANNLTTQIAKVIDRSVVAFLLVYLLCILSFIKLLFNNKSNDLKAYTIAGIAGIFCGWIILVTPPKTLGYASLFTISGIPLYYIWYLPSKHKKL